MSYLFLKYLHIVCVASSFALFFIRGVWAIRAYPSPQEAWVRILPHAVDGLLVLSALGLFAISLPTAWGGDWMLAKFGYIVLYVILAAYALSFARARALKALAWAAALLVFLQATSVAVLHTAKGIFTLL